MGFEGLTTPTPGPEVPISSHGSLFCREGGTLEVPVVTECGVSRRPHHKWDWPSVGSTRGANDCCEMMFLDSWRERSAWKALVFHPVRFLPSYRFVVIGSWWFSWHSCQKMNFSLPTWLTPFIGCNSVKKCHSPAARSSFACDSQHTGSQP
jgi:hypothetical protein